MADARRKILPEEKELIKILINEQSWTQYKAAKVFGISRRSISFILDPEKLKKNREQAKAGGYYNKKDKKKGVIYSTEHRRKKREEEKGVERLKTFEIKVVHQEDTKVYRRRIKKRSKREAEGFFKQNGFIVKSIKQVSKDER